MEEGRQNDNLHLRDVLFLQIRAMETLRVPISLVEHSAGNGGQPPG